MIIMSSGGKRLDWFTKKADDEKIGVDAISDEQLRGFAAPVSVEAGEVGEIGAPVDGADVEVTEGDPVDEVAIEVSDENPVDIPGTVEDESLPSEAGKGDLSGRVADLVDDVKTVQDKLEDIAEDAKQVGDIAKEESGEKADDEAIDEVEIELEDEDEDESVDVEVSEEESLESETPGQVEEDEEGEGGEEGEKDDALVIAGDSRVFAKFASLSPDTKKKVADYFANVLGYDKEYSKLLVKEYN